jgi:hypothetical protein
MAHARSFPTLAQRIAMRDRLRLEMAALRISVDEAGDPVGSDGEGDSEHIEESDGKEEEEFEGDDDKDDENEEEEEVEKPNKKKWTLKEMSSLICGKVVIFVLDI